MDAPEPLANFTLFRRLPIEMRFRIWNLHLNTPRIVEVFIPYGTGQYHWSPPVTWTTQIPPILHVNHEARHEALRVFEILKEVKEFGYLRPGMIINFEMDTVFFSQWNPQIARLLGSQQLVIGLSIKSLAIPLHYRAPYAPFGCPNLQELVVLACPRSCPNPRQRRRVWYKEYREAEEISDVWESEENRAVHGTEIFAERDGEVLLGGAPPGGEIWDFDIWDYDKLRSGLASAWTFSYARGIYLMLADQYRNLMEPVALASYNPVAHSPQTIMQAYQMAQNYCRDHPQSLVPRVLNINRGVAVEGNWAGGMMLFAHPLDRQKREKVVYNEMTGIMTFRLGLNRKKVVYHKNTGVMTFKLGEKLSSIISPLLYYHDGKDWRIHPV